MLTCIKNRVLYTCSPRKKDTHTHIAEHNLSIPKLVSMYVWDCLIEVSACCLVIGYFGGHFAIFTRGQTSGIVNCLTYRLPDFPSLAFRSAFASAARSVTFLPCSF